MAEISMCLWFDNEAEEAASFYTDVFSNSRIIQTLRYGDVGYEVHKREAGTVMTVVFELEGIRFTALNGGPLFQHSPAMSIEVHCDTQEEIDHYWARLGEGGNPDAQQCGWLQDKFGVSWQIVPRGLSTWMKAPPRSERIMAKLLEMKKLDLKILEEA